MSTTLSSTWTCWVGKGSTVVWILVLLQLDGCPIFKFDSCNNNLRSPFHINGKPIKALGGTVSYCHCLFLFLLFGLFSFFFSFIYSPKCSLLWGCRPSD